MFSLSCIKPATCFSFQYAIIRLSIKKQNFTAAIKSVKVEINILTRTYDSSVTSKYYWS